MAAEGSADLRDAGPSSALADNEVPYTFTCCSASEHVGMTVLLWHGPDMLIWGQTLRLVNYYPPCMQTACTGWPPVCTTKACRNISNAENHMAELLFASLLHSNSM